MIRTVTPSAPHNLTLDGLYVSTAVITWSVDDDDVIGFEMTVRPLAAVTHEEIREKLDGQRRSAVVQPLRPGTEYQLYVTSRGADGVSSNASDAISFRTLDGMDKYAFM